MRRLSAIALVLVLLPGEPQLPRSRLVGPQLRLGLAGARQRDPCDRWALGPF